MSEQDEATASRWSADSEEAQNLRRRAESLWNPDYFSKMIVPLLAVPQAGRALDVGTGFGALAFLLAGARPDLEIVGVDPETGLIEGAREAASAMGLDQIEFRVGDGAALELPDASFDLVMCQTVLTHVPDASAVVSEMTRVLKPGGSLLAAEWIDRANMTMPFDNASAVSEDDAADVFRLTRAYSRGRAQLDRGDDAAGVTAPMLAAAAGLAVVDVRLNDRVAWAVPPYADERQRAAIEESRAWTESPPAGDDFRTWVRENMAAAGKASLEADRYVDLIDSASVKRRWSEAITAGRFGFVSSAIMVLTVARKPDG